MTRIARLARDECGVSAIEYCILMALVGMALLFAVSTLGAEISSTFDEAHAALSAGGGSDGDGGEDNDDDDDDDGDDGDDRDGEED